jgi:hypothetical protein
MLDNVVAFVQGGMYQMLQPSYVRRRFSKHLLKAGIATNKQKSVC